MKDWTELMAAQNWCDQYVRNGGTIETACDEIMDDPFDSFGWCDTSEGSDVWEDRYWFLRENYEQQEFELCR